MHGAPLRDTDDDCENWFKSAGLKRGKDCLLSCASTAVDMGTFTCPNRCDDFCNEAYLTKSLFNLSQIYGLTPAEKALAAKEPTKTLRAYVLSWKAERLCSELFKSSRTNDESDACRHFVWASMLSRELGLDFANQVLNAHEQDPRQPERERAMDLANNRQGQLAIESRGAEKSDDGILRSFQENLKKGNLIVISPRPSNRKTKK